MIALAQQAHLGKVPPQQRLELGRLEKMQVEGVVLRAVALARHRAEQDAVRFEHGLERRKGDAGVRHVLQRLEADGAVEGFQPHGGQVLDRAMAELHPRVFPPLPALVDRGGVAVHADDLGERPLGQHDRAEAKAAGDIEHPLVNRQRLRPRVAQQVVKAEAVLALEGVDTFEGHDRGRVFRVSRGRQHS